jgi:NAD(P)-dependent dehydrogenase (short-subunit alcohol dehydrogenase family)/acyl carrier protein
MGLVISEHLARTVQAKLILVARTGLPEREEWDGWLATHSEDDETSQRILKVRNIEGLGAEVVVAGADVARLEEMRQVVEHAIERFGTINGVVHAAGVAGGGIIQLKTSEAASRVLEPKVRGALVLDELLEGVKLDFFVSCSSLASILGEAGQVDYCAANAFLDAFAHARNGRHPASTLTINWPTWQQVGMAVKTAQTMVPTGLRANREESLKRGIAPEEGVEAFGRALSSALPQLAISPYDLRGLIAYNMSSGSTSFLQQAQTSGQSQPAHPRPTMERDYVAPGTDAERSIADHWQQLLGIDQVGVHDDFFELGGHSLLATQLISRLRDAFEVDMPLSTIFENPTVAELAVAIEKARESDAGVQVEVSALAHTAQ